MMKHRQVLANLAEFKLTDFDKIGTLVKNLKNLDDKTIRELIMNLASKSGDKLFIAIERAQNGELTLWAKQKIRVETETHALHIAAWLIQLHRDSVLLKMDSDTQNAVKEKVWRDGFLLCTEETEIEEAGNIRIEWLIDMKELEIKEKYDSSIAMDDTSIQSFGEKIFLLNKSSSSISGRRPFRDHSPTIITE